MGKNLKSVCLDCGIKLTDENWPKSAKKDNWRLCILCYRVRTNKSTKKYLKKRRKEDKDFDRSRHLKADYSITIEEYDIMFEEQEGVCKICGNKETRKNQHGIKRLAVDHNHITGKIRGLLCSCCNMAIGALDVDTQGDKLLIKAAAYIKGGD